MRILFDLDGCGADFHGAVVEAVNEAREAQGGVLPPITVGDIRDWSMVEGFEPWEVENIRETWTAPGFFRDLPVIPGFVETLEWAKEEGHDPVILTSAPLPHSLSEKAEWIEEHVECIDPVSDVVYARRKTLVSGDVIVDDGPHNVATYRAAYPGALILTPSYTFNQHVGHLCTRLEGWADMAGFWSRARSAIASFRR